MLKEHLGVMKAVRNGWAEAACENYRQARQAHWNECARSLDTWTGWGGYYHRRLMQVYQFLVGPGQRILEIGCAQGDLLAALKPSVGVGVDFSDAILRRARRRHPEISFIQTDAHDLSLNEKFDVIILSDLVNDLWDVQTVFQKIAPLATSRTRIILNAYSRLWEPPLTLAKWLGLSQPTLYQNWLTVEDITGLLRLANFQII